MLVINVSILLLLRLISKLLSLARLGAAGPGMAWRGAARHGKIRQGKDKTWKEGGSVK